MEPTNVKSAAQHVVDDVLDRFKNFTMPNGEKLDLTDGAGIVALYQDAQLVRASPTVREAIVTKTRELDGLQAKFRELEVGQAQVATILELHEDYCKTIGALALYIREHYQEQIAAGLHNGLRLEDVIIRYLEQGQKQAQAKRRHASVTAPSGLKRRAR